MTTLATGTPSITGSGSNNGTLTSTGARVTVIHLGVHCIFETNNTAIGALTGSATTGGNATLDISARIPRVGGERGVFCGEGSLWTGSYKVTSPSVLNLEVINCERVAPEKGDFTTPEDCKRTANYQPGKGEWRRSPI